MVSKSSSYIKHYNNFNLIRLFAALQVLVVHVYNHFEVSNLFVVALKGIPGVPLFFFISGFLITKTYVKKKSLGDIAYFINRAIRIFPALFLCVVITLLAVLATGYLKDKDASWLHIGLWTLGQATFGQVYNPDFMRGFGVGVINGALWTILVELQFYVLTPILFSLFNKVKSVFWLIFMASIVINVAFRLGLMEQIPYNQFVYVSFLPWVFMFMVGFLMAVRPDFQEKVKRIPLLAILAAYVVTMLLVGEYEFNAMNSINPISAILLGLLIFRLAYVNLRIPKFLRSFTDRNDISYGIYIYHMPIINFLLFYGIFQFEMNFLVTVLLAVIFAFLSWKLLEQPLLKYKKSTTKQS